MAANSDNGPMRLGLVVVMLVLVFGVTARPNGHHSIAGVYDQAAPVTIDGIVTAFKMVNPHPFLTLAVTRGGRDEAWKLELDNRYELVDVGMNERTFRVGDRLVVKGSPARDGSRALYASRIDRPADGFWYEQVGSSPRIRR